MSRKPNAHEESFNFRHVSPEAGEPASYRWHHILKRVTWTEPRGTTSHDDTYHPDVVNHFLKTGEWIAVGD